MTLLDLIPGLKRIGATGGGEWAGPCPFCGGRDRFRVWPEEGPTGRYWCRFCGERGDGLQLLRDLNGLTFPEALKVWGLPSLTWKPGPPTEPTPTAWTPRETTAPGSIWQKKAASFLAGCQRNLAGPSGADCREWLKGRGLKIDTVEQAGLGWNPLEQYESREAWGLTPETKEDGKLRWIWIPRGLVIPCFDNGRVIRLRVRRPDPGDRSRYVIISGSSSMPMTWDHDKKTLVILESELDGLLLHQVAGDLVGAVSLGNAQTRPDQETNRTLKKAGLLLIALDSDEAGAKESLWWKRIYRNAKRWPVPVGKDPTEAAQAGLDLRGWVKAGLMEIKIPAQNKTTAHQEGTHATRAVTEGFDRRAEIRPFLFDEVIGQC